MIALVCWLGFCALLSFVAVIAHAKDGEGVATVVVSLMFFIHTAFFIFLLVRAGR